MANSDLGDPLGGPDAFRIDDRVLRALREGLSSVASQTIAAVMAEVPGYRVGFRGPMGESIQAAVQMAIGGFLKLAAGSRDVDPSTPRRTTLEGAYALGRGEARAGRSMDALLAAYRVGARVSWRGLARNAAEAGLPATAMAEFAELLFGYIDELSAASVAGYNDELNTSGRVRERYRERLGQRLLAGAAQEVLIAAAERAEWTPPGSLTAVLLPAAQVHGVLALVGADALLVTEDLPGVGQLGRRAAVRAAAGARRRRCAVGGTCCGCWSDGRQWSGHRAPGSTSEPRTTARSGRWRWSRRSRSVRPGGHRGPPRRPGRGCRSRRPGGPACSGARAAGRPR